MVTCFSTKSARRKSGALITEIVIAMAILMLALMPLAYTYVNNQKLVRRLYQKAVAIEIIDGEMEILMSGEWHSFKEGSQPYSISAAAAKNLPPGETRLTITGKYLRLEWAPESRIKGGPVVREGTVK